MTAAKTRRTETNGTECESVAVVEALHCLRVAITIFDADERLIFANEHFTYLFRSLPPQQELIGKRYEDLIRMEIAGGDIGLLGEDVEAYVARRRTQLFARDHGSRDIPLTDGRVVEIKTRRTPSLGWIALWTDVTEARRNLDRLHAAIDLSADAFAFYDKYDRLVLCNADYATLKGAAKPEELVGLRYGDIIMRMALTGQIKGEAKSWLERRKAVHAIAAGAMTMELTDGRAFMIRDRACSDGGRVVVLTDVSEHQRIEQALDEQTQALNDTRKALAATKAQTQVQANYLADLSSKLDQTQASADTTKKTLLRTMSHELKTPLNAIIGFSDLLGTLADSAGPDQIREYSGLINLGGKNLLRLINQILDLTKISGGRYELNRQTIDAGEFLWGIKDRFAEAAEEKDQIIVADDAVAGHLINADEIAFGAICSHLIENAIAFTQPQGTIWLKVEDRGNTVAISVSDNGPGVRPEDLTRILEPFEQGGRSTTDHPNGAGLGLTLVKAFCELQGGKLTLESALGAGFTAIAELPKAE